MGVIVGVRVFVGVGEMVAVKRVGDGFAKSKVFSIHIVGAGVRVANQ